MVLFYLLASCIAPALGAAARALVHLCARVMVVGCDHQVAVLDRWLARHGWCSARTGDPTPLPAAGAHFGWLGGPFVALRHSEPLARGGVATTYTVYSLGCEAAIRQEVSGDPRLIVNRHVYAPAPWRTSSDPVRIRPPAAAYPWQKRAVDQLMSAVRASAAAHDPAEVGRASALICGPPGIGKNTVAELLAERAQRELKVEVEVVSSFDLTSPGLLLGDGFNTGAGKLVILALDEFDTTVDFAQRKEGSSREGRSLADSPSSLLAVLDRMGKTDGLVVIATSNKPLGDMLAGDYRRYTRPGRLNLHIEAAE